MKYGESKEKALTFLKSSRSSIPSLNRGRRPRNHPSISKEWVMYSSVKDECIIKNCSPQQLFKQNWFFTNEPARSFITREDYNYCYWGYAGAESVNLGLYPSHYPEVNGEEKVPECWTCHDFPNAVDEGFRMEIYREFDLFKNYFWEDLMGSNMEIQNKNTNTNVNMVNESVGASATKTPKETVNTLRSIINKKICKTEKYGSKQARHRHEDIFKNTYPEVDVSKIKSRPVHVTLDLSTGGIDTNVVKLIYWIIFMIGLVGVLIFCNFLRLKVKKYLI